MKKLAYFIPLAIFAVISGFLLSGIGKDPSELPSPLIGKPVPPFALSELHSGKVLTEKDLSGRPILLNVWASWCPACKMEHAYLQHLADEGVVIVGLNYKDESEDATNWLRQLGNPYAFVVEDKLGKLGLDLGVFGAPETFFIDKFGIVQQKHVGVLNEWVWTEKFLDLYSTDAN